MKKLIISFLGLALLLPAFTYAGSYCVKLPSGGDSKWTKRDNSIPVRFAFSYAVVTDKDGHVWAKILENSIGADQTGYKPFGTYNPAHYGYKYIDYGASDYCLDINELTANFNRAFDKLTSSGKPVDLPGQRDRYYDSNFSIRIEKIWADVKYGGDCPKISGKQVTSGSNHVVKIHRRRGDHINPFGCKWW